MNILEVLNFAFVLIFGIVLSLAFTDIPYKKHKKTYILLFCGFGLLQLITLHIWGREVLFKAYPLLVHLPLYLALRLGFKKNVYIAALGVLSAYLFCTPRKWLGTFVSAFFAYDAEVSLLVQILVTVPLLYLLIKWVAPYVIALKYESARILQLILIVPFCYYFIEYFLTVYTDLLYMGSPAVVEFMDSCIVTIYFVFSVIYLRVLYKKNQLEIDHALLGTMNDSLEKELKLLKQSQIQAAIYRHDLRHHMNYLNACLAEHKLQEAADYIEQTCADINNTKVEQFSENEPLNLILSSYVGKAREKEIVVEIIITAADFSRFHSTDLCSLLANALENAIKAAGELQDVKERFIKLRLYEKNNKLCLEIKNSYKFEPIFHNHIPVAKKYGHGVGVKSIIHVVEKYEGVYGFFAKDGVFTLQVSM